VRLGKPHSEVEESDQPQAQPNSKPPPEAAGGGEPPTAQGEVAAMANTQDTPGTNKPNPVTQELLEKLGKPTQPPASAASVTGGVTEVQGCETDVAKPQPEGSSVEVQARAVDVAKPQKPPAVEAAQSLEVDCRYCGGCCGNRRGLRLPAGVVELIQLVEGKLGLRYECQVINKYPELFCRRIGRRRRRVASVKEFERLLSREVEYKASYVLVRLNECRNDAVCWRYLRLGVEGWLDAVYRLAGREPTVNVDDYVGRLARGLGFRGVVDLARYLKFLVQFLMDFNYVNRGRGFHDVLSVRCRLCGEVIDVTGPLPSVLARLIRHFKREHGLKAIGDVETKVKELRERETSRPEVDDTGIKLLRNSAEVTQLVRLMVHRLVDRGLLERIGKSYRCRACNADVGDAIDALVHVLKHHYDVFDKLLGGRAMPSVDGFNDAVDELASLFNSGNPNGIKPVVKALVQGIIDVLNVRGSASVRMLTRWLSEDDDYRLLLSSLTTGSVKAERVVAMIVEVMARHGLVQVSGGVVKLNE
jgi:hypothetical protein